MRSICRPISIICPRPLSAASSSQATSTTQARVRATRTPVTMAGTAAGKAMRATRVGQRRRYTAATSKWLRGMARMPSTVARATGKNAVLATIATLKVSSMPSSSTSIGIRAMLGICRRVWNSGAQ